MNRITKIRIGAAVIGVAILTPFAVPQIGKIIKVIGVWEVTRKYGGEINDAFNKLIKRDPRTTTSTKVVPIVSGGIGSRQAIGMVQVSGPKLQVDKVKAVAQLEQDLFGKEVRIRAMVPMASETISNNVTPVEQVGVTGIVDFKL
jgi:hypothetical protein